MDRSDTIKLIAETKSQDDNGVWQSTKTEREVFCQVDSVTRDEFFNGGRNGLNPEFRITMFGPDYRDERIVEYCGKQYAVYRIYQERNDLLELYVERKGGTNIASEISGGSSNGTTE